MLEKRKDHVESLNDQSQKDNNLASSNDINLDFLDDDQIDMLPF